ncbi:MAG: hypothetical protein WDN09_00420 [bacterium]
MPASAAWKACSRLKVMRPALIVVAAQPESPPMTAIITAEKTMTCTIRMPLLPRILFSWKMFLIGCL